MKPSEQVPYQLDGEPCSLYKLVRKETDWAVSRINYSVDRIAELEQELLEERASYEAERQRLLDAIEMYESWMKRKPGREWGTVWNDICREYPYLATEKET